MTARSSSRRASTNTRQATDHSAGAHNRVGANGHAFADDRAITDPDIIFQHHGSGFTDGAWPVVDAVPVCVGYIDPGGEHGIGADIDPRSRVYAYPRAQQRIIMHADLADAMLVGPGGQAYGAIACGHYVHRGAEVDVGAVQFQMPWLHDHATRAEAFELWGDVMIHVPPFDNALQAFQGVGSVISAHGRMVAQFRAGE